MYCSYFHCCAYSFVCSRDVICYILFFMTLLYEKYILLKFNLYKEWRTLLSLVYSPHVQHVHEDCRVREQVRVPRSIYVFGYYFVLLLLLILGLSAGCDEVGVYIRVECCRHHIHSRFNTGKYTIFPVHPLFPLLRKTY